MRLAHVTFTVAPNNAGAALDTLVASAATVRQMTGCLAFIPFANPGVDGGLGVLHEWETAEAFAGYLASPVFAGVNEVLRPMMTSAPLSRRFDASLVPSPN
jgi:quinol monooxygenase YgiN